MDPKSTAKNISIIGVTALLGSFVGFFLQLLVAYYFGATKNTDAFFMAQSTSDLLSKMLMGGSVTAIFIPLFIERLTKGKQHDAWALAMNIIHTFGALYIMLIGIVFVFSQQFVHFIAPGFDASASILTTQLLRVLLPSFFFLFMVDIATSILQSLKDFTLPAILRIVAPLISALSILVLAGSIGIYSFAIGVVVGSAVQALILVWGLRKKGMEYRFVLNPFTPSMRSLFYLVYPFLLSVFMTQGAGIVYRVLVSHLAEGSLSALRFAEKITQLITIIFINSVTLVIYPLLSEKASIFDVAGVRNTIGKSIRLVVFTTLPLIITVAILRTPIIDVVYQHGSFSVQDARLTSVALLYLVLGLTTTGISSIFGHAILALQETRAAVAITISSQAVAIALFVLLVPKMGMAGLALASSLVPLSSALLYYIYLTRFIPSLHIIFQHSSYIKIIMLSVVGCGVVFVSKQFFTYNNILEILISTLLGASSYGLLAYAWKLEEAHEIYDIIASKLQRKRTI